MQLSRIRIVPMLALALMMAIGSVSMAAAQSTPSASPENGASGTPVENLGCWAEEPNMDSGYPQWSSAPEMTIDESTTYIATIETNRGTIVAELYTEQAPETVNNFVCLASEGYFDGVIFHRVILDFMIQTGDPTGTGRGGPGYAINDELPGEDLTYAEGVLAMANSGPNTGGSQFFINHADNSTRLDTSYAIFGQVTEGMDVVDTIARIPVEPSPSGEQSSPVATMTVLSITITEQ